MSVDKKEELTLKRDENLGMLTVEGLRDSVIND